MNNWIIIGLLAILLLFSFDDSETQALEVSTLEVLKSEGLIAFYMATIPSQPDEPLIEECPCKGTKKISRDGRIFTDCDCIIQTGQCDCPRTGEVPTTTQIAEVLVEVAEKPVIQEAPKKKEIKLVAFTADWCIPCRWYKDNYYPKIKKKYPKMFESVDIDKEPNKYGFNKIARAGIPRLALVVDGQIVNHVHPHSVYENNKWKKLEEFIEND